MECILADNKEGYGVVGDFGWGVIDVVLQKDTDCETICGVKEADLIIEKYLTEDGKVNVKKIRALAYDPFNHDYYEVSKKVGKAFSDGRVIQSSK